MKIILTLTALMTISCGMIPTKTTIQQLTAQDITYYAGEKPFSPEDACVAPKSGTLVVVKETKQIFSCEDSKWKLFATLGIVENKATTNVTGAAGSVGATGAQGIQGEKGDTGATGLPGLAGATGPQGAIGLTGATGATGAQGPQGVQGMAGLTGLQGAQGIQGAAGAKGDTGNTGPTGSMQYATPYRLERISTLQLNVVAVGGLTADTTMRFLFNDGTFRTHVGTLSVDFSNGVVDTYLDTGTKAASTWYYVYAIDDGSGTGFRLVLSVRTPRVGPLGTTTFKYLGAFYSDPSLEIRNFSQTGRSFMYTAYTPLWTATPGVNTDAHTISLDGVIPKTASVAVLSVHNIHAVNWTNTPVTQYLGPVGDVQRSSCINETIISNERLYTVCRIATLGTTKAVDHSYTSPTAAALGQSYVYAMGWEDEFIREN